VTPRGPLVLLAGIGLALAGIIVVEALPAPDPAVTAASGPVAAANLPVQTPHATGPVPDRDDMVEILLARPPFALTRRPDRLAAAADAGGRQEAPAPRLAGIMVTGGERRAIFQPTEGDHQLVIAEGGDVSGWTVDKIAGGTVTVSGPQGTRVLEPSFDPNAKPAEPALPPKIGTVPVPGAPSQPVQHPPVGVPFDPRRPAPLPPVQPNRLNNPIQPRQPPSVRPNSDTSGD
jgi:hypothetical protein